MTRELLIGVAAAMILSPSAFAQSAAGAPAGTPSGATVPAAPATAPAPSGSFVTDSINATLQAGKIPDPESATVGAASTGTGLRAPKTSAGSHSGATGSTPYAGPGSAVAIPPGSTPYTGPASLPAPVPAGGAPGR
jgi:hypothetical protein